MKKVLLFLVVSMLLTGGAFAATTTTDVEPGERLVVTGTCADGDAVDLIKSGTFYIYSILWQGATATGHDLELVTGASEHNLITIKCTTANEALSWYPETIVRGGLYVDQMDSGTLTIIYHNARR